eukprot:12145966-Alexandrium_andersonii.AAC.1
MRPMRFHSQAPGFAARISEIPMARGVRQGAAASPAVWAIALNRLRWGWRHLGYDSRLGNSPASLASDSGLFPLSIFADDFVLLGASRDQLSAMLSSLQAALRKGGLEVQPGNRQFVYNCRVADGRAKAGQGC